jgi:hypothetical protein
MTEKEITLAILSLGQGRIVGAFKQLHPTDIVPAVNPNGHCAKVLAQGVVKGFFTLDDIKSAPVHVATSAAVDPAMFDAIGAVANRAETIALEAKGEASSAIAKARDILLVADDMANHTKKSLLEFREKLQAERDIAVNVNPDIVETAVTKLIAKEFDAFKRVVADAKAEEVIADMTAVHVVGRRSALDVFGFDIRERNGDPVMVDIWNHPARQASIHIGYGQRKFCARS